MTFIKHNIWNFIIFIASIFIAYSIIAGNLQEYITFDVIEGEMALCIASCMAALMSIITLEKVKS